MKTAVTVLQEFMVKLGETPEYECTAQSGPQHHAVFEYRCKACGVMVRASARSKKEAKQKAARFMLQQLALHGYPVPGAFAPNAKIKHPMMVTGASTETRSYVAMLKELCDQYHLSSVEYQVVNSMGSPHLRQFTIKARMGLVERVATSTTKKMARQLAAEQLYYYLRQNLSGVKPNIEKDATMRKNKKSVRRKKNKGGERSTRPDLGMVESEYHLGLTARLDARTRERTYAALEQSRSMSPKRGLATVAAALRLEVVYNRLVRKDCYNPVIFVKLRSCSPDMAFAGYDQTSAAKNALNYLRLTLSPSEPESIEDTETTKDSKPEPARNAERSKIQEPSEDPEGAVALEFSEDIETITDSEPEPDRNSDRAYFQEPTEDPERAINSESSEDIEATKDSEPEPARNADRAKIREPIEDPERAINSESSEDIETNTDSELEPAGDSERAQVRESTENPECAKGPESFETAIDSKPEPVKDLECVIDPEPTAGPESSLNQVPVSDPEPTANPKDDTKMF